MDKKNFQVLEILKLIGEAHDKLIEAQESIDVGDDEFPSELYDIVDDLESSLSEWDMMGESDPEKALYKKLDDDFPEAY